MGEEEVDGHTVGGFEDEGARGGFDKEDALVALAGDPQRGQAGVPVWINWGVLIWWKSDMVGEILWKPSSIFLCFLGFILIY